jgi:hypothetical protein
MTDAINEPIIARHEIQCALSLIRPLPKRILITKAARGKKGISK